MYAYKLLVPWNITVIYHLQSAHIRVHSFHGCQDQDADIGSLRNYQPINPGYLEKHILELKHILEQNAIGSICNDLLVDISDLLVDTLRIINITTVIGDQFPNKYLYFPVLAMSVPLPPNLLKS